MRAGYLFDAGGLFGGPLGHLLGRGRQFLAAGGDVVGGADHVTHHLLELFDHVLEGSHQLPYLILAGNLDRHGQITGCKRVGNGYPIVNRFPDAARNQKGSHNPDDKGNHDNRNHDLQRLLDLDLRPAP